MSEIWVLGAGQLGAMLQHAAMPMALSVNTIDINASEIPELDDDAIITVELEHWPDTPVTQHLSAHRNFLNRETLKIFADRSIQKRLLDSLNLPHANWALVEEHSTQENLYQQLGHQVLLKRRSGGYDGKGQLWLDKGEQTHMDDDWKNSSIAEEKICFDEEVSVIGARGADGKNIFYPLTANYHYAGILLASVAPYTHLQDLQSQAESMLGKLMDELDYIGVMAMECFVLDGRLYINEIAPRVHNSGHWTQAGATISQFEMHLRAITNLTLTKPIVKNPSMMLNTLGMPFNPAWSAVQGSEVYWYGKGVRAMRKLGHINLSLPQVSQTISALNQLEPLLDDYYAQAISWCIKHLSKCQG